jgi:predicted nucleic acid-binding protein
LIVVDASAVLEVLLRTEASEAIGRHLFAPGESLHAPHLIDVEIAQVLRRYASRGEITGFRGKQAIEDLAGLAMTRYPHDLLLGRMWAMRHNVSACDAAYLALAEALDAPLITRDARLAAAPARRARIVLL